MVLLCSAAKRSLVLVVIISLSTFLIGCSSDQKKKSDLAAATFFDKWRARAERSIGHSPTRSYETLAAREFPGQKPLVVEKAPPLPTRNITMKLQSLEVGTALRAIAKAVNQNIVINSEIKGTVDVDVSNAPWDQVFKGVLRTHNLDYAWQGNIIRVMTEEEKDREEERQILTRIVPIQFANAANLQENIQKILLQNTSIRETAESKEADQISLGTVMVDEHNNALIIQARKDDIQRLIPVIHALDKPTAQILIQAHIVETTKETARALGIQWGGLLNEGDNWLYRGVGEPSAGDPGGFGITTDSAGNPTGLIPGIWSNFPSAAGSSGQQLKLGYLLGDLTGNMLVATLTALQEDGKLNILSSPSITTLENQKALIESGAEVPFQTVDRNGNISIEWKKATLKLEVIPHVIDGSNMKLQIQTRKDELDFTQPVLGNPTILTKNAETNVVLEDGQTTVIGGLNKETVTGGHSGIPGLKDIPGGGHLFGTTSEGSKMEEVLIFITPYILKTKTYEQFQGIDLPT